MSAVITIEFEDHGQDFLRWKIANGVVIDCMPFQAWLWVGAQVRNSSTLRRGGHVKIQTKQGQKLQVKYPLTKVSRSTRGGAS